MKPLKADAPYITTHYAIASIDSGDGKVAGVAKFIQKTGEKAQVYVEMNGLTAGKHGIHIHEFGNLSQGCTSAGAHYNPYGRNHGGPSALLRHVGDLGNLESNGPTLTTVLNNLDPFVQLYGTMSVVGRSVVIHADEDDLGLGGQSDSLTTGHAGARLACGVIGTCAPFDVPTL